MSRPYRLAISSRDLRREHFIGTYSTMGQAYRSAKRWINGNKRASGCLLYITNRATEAEYVLR